ncbi:MAG TPA: hypothetical protein VF732_02485 [Nitrospira sp.]
MNTSVIRGLLVCGLILIVAGCTHYYRVTDPGTGKTYYTTDLNEERGGAVKLKDDRTKSTVTLQSSEVREISEDEYEAEIKGTGPVVIPPPVVTQPPVATQPPATTQPMR